METNGWTPERRARQSVMIQQWQPWKKSTGPMTKEGKAKVAQNGYKGGTWRLIRDLARALREQQRATDSCVDR